MNKSTIWHHLLLFCVLALNPCISALQAEPIKLHSYYIPGLVDSPDSGIMVDMLRKVEKSSGLVFDLVLAPTKRVQRNFENNFIFGYFPELEEHRPNTSNCRTDAFMQKKIITVVRKGEPVITSVAQLEGKRVGAVLGYSYGKEIVDNPKIKLIRVDNDKTNLKKLLANRIDVIVGDVHSTVNGINETNNQSKVTYDLNNPVSRLDVFFLFQGTEQGKRTCQALSSAITKLRQEGDLFNWFGYR